MTTASPRSNEPSIAGDAGRQQALAGKQRLLGAGIEEDLTVRNKLAGNPALLRRDRIGIGDEPGHARTFLDGAQRVRNFARRNDHIGAGREHDLGGFDFGFHAAFRKLGTGVSRHGLDVGRDGGDERDMLGVGSSFGGAV